MACDAAIVDMHCEATSEKMAMGHFCDGRASLVVGTHTHVPTADCQILNGGTAYQTDAGACADYDSVIGNQKEEPLRRFTTRISQERYKPASGPATVCGVFVETDDRTGLATRIEPIRSAGGSSRPRAYRRKSEKADHAQDRRHLPSPWSAALLAVAAGRPGGRRDDAVHQPGPGSRSWPRRASPIRSSTGSTHGQQEQGRQARQARVHRADAEAFFGVLDRNKDGYIGSTEVLIYERFIVPEILQWGRLRPASSA